MLHRALTIGAVLLKPAAFLSTPHDGSRNRGTDVPANRLVHRDARESNRGCLCSAPETGFPHRRKRAEHPYQARGEG